MEKAYKLSRRKFLEAALLAAAASGASVACTRSTSAWRFLTVDEAKTLAAACDQIIPPDEAPGAEWAGVVNYIDRQLCSPLRHLRETYRWGIAAMNKSSRLLYGSDFAVLPNTKQFELLTKMEEGHAPQEAWQKFHRRSSSGCSSITLCKAFTVTLVTAETAEEQGGRWWVSPIRPFGGG